jgi:hypothetical protein
MTLLPNTTYYYRVKALTSTEESDFSNTVSVTTIPDSNYSVTPLPASPPLIYKTTPFSNRVDILIQDTDPAEYIKELKLTVSTNSDYSSPLYSSLTFSLLENSSSCYVDGVKYIVISIANLAANTLYYCKVKTSNTVSLSIDTTFTFTTDKTLKAPLAIGITDLTSITGIANWNPVIGATGYRIDVSTDSAFTSLVVSNVDAGNTVSYTIPVLIENTTYYYRVRAYNADPITSNNSNIVSFKTLEASDTLDDLNFILNTPTIKQVSNLNTTEVEIELVKDSNAIEYIYDVSTSISFGSFISQDVSSSVRKIKLTGLSSGTVYYFRVKAINGVSVSSYVSTNFTTLTINSSLTVVQTLTPTALYSTAFVLNWVKRNYANRYFVQVSTVLNFASILKSFYVGDIDSLVIDSLTPATSYYCRVYALNNVATSNVSNVVTAVTQNALPAITLNSVSQLSDSSVTLNWNIDGAYISYSLSIAKVFNAQTTEYLGNGYFNERPIGNVSKYSVTVFLEPATSYNYIVTGTTASGDKKTSTLGTFTTKNKSSKFNLSSDGSLLEWDGEVNRLEVSTDKDFKFLLSGWTPRPISSFPKSFNILPLMESPIGYYIRGYFDSGVKGNYSNILSTYEKHPILLPANITKSTALLKWKKNSSTSYRIQVQYDTGSSIFAPITGHTFPVDIGDTDSFLVTGLTANTVHSVQIQYKTTTGYSPMGLPVLFKTNRYQSPADVTLNGSLTITTATTSNISFDRFDVTLSAGYDVYLLQVSKRSDFLQIESYIEVEDINLPVTILGDESTDYYIRLYGVDLTSNRITNHQTLIEATEAITVPSVSLTGVPNISNVLVLNENEVLITFTTVTNATGYTLEISESNTFSNLSSTYSTSFVDINKVLVSGLLATKTYYARMYAFNANRISGYGSIGNVDTTP